MTKRIQFIEMTPKELINQLKAELLPELIKEIEERTQPKEPEEYLTAKETQKILSISHATLWRWKNNGIVKAYGIKNRVYFKRSEIAEILDKNEL